MRKTICGELKRARRRKEQVRHGIKTQPRFRWLIGAASTTDNTQSIHIFDYTFQDRRTIITNLSVSKRI